MASVLGIDLSKETFHAFLLSDRGEGKRIFPSGKQYRISTTLATSTRQIARVKNCGDMLEEYEFHEEAKCADASGEPCDKQTVGLLRRRHVSIVSMTFIGKESNKLEEVEEGSVPDAGDVYTEYPDPRATSG